jgi:sec-independent protein translocase protein TatC
MALADHLREFRARLMRSVLVFVLAFIVALVFYNHYLIPFIMSPYNDARHQLGSAHATAPYIAGATGGLTLQMKLCGWAALVISAPYWLLQIWRFVLPGLYPQERKWTRIFAAVAGPLFIAGIATGYYVLPKGLQVLISFTPAGVQNLNELGAYVSFLTRMLLVFGISFEIPLFVVLLNLMGLVTGQMLGKYRSWIIVGTMIFAAVATPSTDPFSMLMLAIPMLMLFLGAEVFARTVDRMRGRGKHKPSNQWSDDEASPI